MVAALTDDECIRCAKSLSDDLDHVCQALDHFLKAEFNIALEMVSETGSLRLYHILGKAFLCFIRTMFTFDPVDIKKTLDEIEECISVASAIKASQRQTLYSRVASVFRFGRSKADENEELQRLGAHCDLIIAELSLLRAVILIATDECEGWVLMIKQSLHIHQSYSFYLRALKSPFMDTDPHFRSGVLLGNGVFNLIFPLLPPRISQVFSIFGYKGNTFVGIEQLQECAMMSLGEDKIQSIRSPLSALVVLIYHLIVAFILPTSQRISDDGSTTIPHWHKACNEIIQAGLTAHPNSPIFVYFQGRFLFVQGKLREAMAVFEDGLKQDIEWPEMKHAGYWELVFCSLYTLDWSRGYKYAKQMSAENKWSKAFYCYLEAVFLWSMDKTKIAEVKELLGRIPGLMKRVAGRTIPVEKFALHRALMVIEEDRAPFHPALEIALVWDGMPLIPAVDRERIETIMVEAMPNTEDVEQKAQILLTLMSIKRINGCYDAALEHGKSALGLQVPDDSYCVPMASLELAHIYLQKGNLKEAERCYNESVSYKNYYLVKKFLEIRQSRMRIEIELAKKKRAD